MGAGAGAGALWLVAPHPQKKRRDTVVRERASELNIRNLLKRTFTIDSLKVKRWSSGSVRIAGRKFDPLFLDRLPIFLFDGCRHISSSAGGIVEFSPAIRTFNRR